MIDDANWLRRSKKARWIAFWRWFATAVTPLIVTILVAWTPGDRLTAFARLGLVQPPLAALLALVIVSAMRLSWGRFQNDTRKGTTSASSATIAIRLWMVCFALLLGGMLLSGLVTRLPETSSPQENRTRSAEIRVDVRPNNVSSAVSVRVNR